MIACENWGREMSEPQAVRIAMWSGPRNLSTAMMYSFGARGDCRVVDEPFYAAYLARSGQQHPMRDEILAAQPHDPVEVVSDLLGPCAQPVFYQKHMCHHMLPDMPLDWISQVRNVFLIRHPNRVLASYAQKREGPSLMDIGFVQQAEVFDRVIASGSQPVVIDAKDIRDDPGGMLIKLCARLGIPWTSNMLKWPRGGHPSDGVWAAHWYGAVHVSTGFAGPEAPVPQLDAQYDDIAKQAMPFYERLSASEFRISAADPAPPTT